MIEAVRGFATRGLALLALLFVALMCAGAVVQPPPVRHANDPASFDARGAQARLARIVGDETPHPVDSEAADAVRERLLAEIRALGFAPDVDERFVCTPQASAPAVDCARVRKVTFSLGPDEGPTILAAAHYDSVAAGSGASDDGVGVAAWLETARLLARQTLRRRVLFLFSDGEEPGLMGARAFAVHDPRAASVEAIVNLEARGVRGPAMFFETNTPNADSVRAFAAGARRPVANSIMADVYALLPNSTDVSVLRREGVDIVNIAFLDGVEAYHTPRDALANVDPRSLQHMGDLALGVTRAFAVADDAGRDETLVFADIASFGFIVLPEWMSRAALGLCAALALVFFWRACPQGRWRALALPPVIVVVAGVLAFGAGFLLPLVRQEPAYWFAFPAATRAWTILLALLSVALALLMLGKNVRPQLAQAAGMVWFALIGFAGALALPGASIFFLPPAAIYCLGAAIGLAWRPATTLGAILPALLALILLGPIVALLEASMGYDIPLASTLVVAILSLTWLGVVTATQQSSWRLPTIAVGGAALVALAFALFAPAWSAARPQPLNITYAVQADEQQARVLAGVARRKLPAALANAAAFEPERVIPGDPQTYWAAPADYVEVARPALTLSAVETAGEERVVRARLQTNGIYRTTLRIPRASRPLRVSVNGVETRFADISPAGDYVSVVCHGRACDGAELFIVLEADGDIENWTLLGQTPGVHEIVAALVRARPADATPIQFGDSVLSISAVAAP